MVIPWFVVYNSDVNMVMGVDKQAFQGAKSLTSVKLPYVFLGGYLIIDDYAFNDCSLTSFTINEMVNKIGEKAFYYCDKMKVTRSTVQ